MYLVPLIIASHLSMYCLTASPDHQPMDKRVSVLSNTSEVLRASSPQLCLTHWRSESSELKEGNNVLRSFQCGWATVGEYT